MILIKKPFANFFCNSIKSMSMCEDDTMRERRNFVVKLYREIVTLPDQDDRCAALCCDRCAVRRLLIKHLQTECQASDWVETRLIV